MSTDRRQRIAEGLKAIGRWSMADVFIVGMVIVFLKAEGFHFHYAARAGLYLYAASAILSAVAAHIAGGSAFIAAEVPPDQSS